jgi:hypothetical protein
MIELSAEQKRAYERFIKARNAVGLGHYWRAHAKKWVVCSDVEAVLEVTGQNHPVYVQNDLWQEYKEASLAWWAVEPQFRKEERMSMIRGDYGDADSWAEKKPRVKEI